MKYPQVRLRRLRENPKIRQMLAEHRLLSKELIQPLFIKEGMAGALEIPSMPGQFQFSEKSVLEEAKKIESLGIQAVILFLIPSQNNKTPP